MTELMNMLFGNTSLQPGIRLMSFELPDSMYRHYPGPKFGRQGIRELCGIEKGPILMSALKPLGRSVKDFGETAYKLALGGCPLIKDDHSLFNQSYAPFKDRVKACVDSVNNANAKREDTPSTSPTVPQTAWNFLSAPWQHRNWAPAASWQPRDFWDSL